MMQKLILFKRVLSEDECTSLSKNIKFLPDDKAFVAAKLDKSVDASLFEIMNDAARTCNPLKLAVASVSSMDIVAFTQLQLLSQKCQWGIDNLDFKTQMFIPIKTHNPVCVSVSLGSTTEQIEMQDGFAYFWPAMSEFKFLSCPEDTSIFIVGKTIGKKLN